MKKILTGIRKGYGKKLVSIHLWNAWLVLILAVSGLMLVGGFWRELLGEGRVWLKMGPYRVRSGAVDPCGLLSAPGGQALEAAEG
ncbi:hypothetical protein ACFTAO_42560 [Paenibacillus rhizoplanae]